MATIRKKVICKKCGKLRRIRGCPVLGYCATCYQKRKPCISCGLSKRTDAQGECKKCYRMNRGFEMDRRPEPTEEELKKIIDEQLACLPNWWSEADIQAIPKNYEQESHIRVVCIRVVGGRSSRKWHFLW